MNEKPSLPVASPVSPPSYHWASISPEALKNDEEKEFLLANDKFEKYITDLIRSRRGEVTYPIDEMHQESGSYIYNERILELVIANARALGFHARLTTMTKTERNPRDNEEHKYNVNVLQISKSPFAS
jgi:hypothetical protein